MQGAVMYVRGFQPLLPACTSASRSLRSKQLVTMDAAQQSGSAAGSCGAYVEKFTLTAKADGPLAGLKFAVKDMYDVAGYPTGFGNPVWKATHPIPHKTSPIVEALTQAGAILEGKTHMDELAYSLNGENVHYGTPLNPAAPDRVPGGSSSGSASCVASGDVDFSLGSDTGGSVRVPASFCGVLGIRTTHSALSLQHARPLSPRFDTVGWFARDPQIFRAVGSVLFDDMSPAPEVPYGGPLVICKDAFSLVDADTRSAFKHAIHQISACFGGGVEEIDIAAGVCGGSLSSWVQVFRILQAQQTWKQHGEWINANDPNFGSGVKKRFETASMVTDEQASSAERSFWEIRQCLNDEIEHGGILCVPSAPGPAPILNSPDGALDDFRNQLLSLCCIAGIGGFPEVSLPLVTASGAPVGIGLIGPRGSDTQLLALTQQIFEHLQKTESAA